ncbi:hypothetical protein V8017_04435 [Stenotrophomonas rhizophila]
MTMHDCFVFPAAPHLPAPDMPALERWMLQERIILPAVGADVPAKALYALSHAISRLPGANVPPVDADWRTAADVVATHVQAGNLPDALRVNGDGSVEDCVKAIRDHGIALDDAWLFGKHAACTWFSPRYRAGPGMVRLYDPDRIGEIDHLSIVLFQIDAGEPPFVVFGAGTSAPTVPGEDTEREDFPPFGDYMDFIGAVYEDLHADWVHPDSGRRYALLDLDWEYSLGIGRCFIQFEGGSGYDLERFVQALGEACGQRMTYAHRLF